MKKLRDIRIDYKRGTLSEHEIPNNPYKLLTQWMDTAIAEKIPEPTAICLSTIKFNGAVSSRIVLAKEIQENGLVFFSNRFEKKCANKYTFRHLGICLTRVQEACAKIDVYQ